MSTQETRLSNQGWMPGNTFNILLKLGNDISKSLDPKTGAMILDIACGPSGTCALSVLKRYPDRQINMTAIDSSQKAIDSFTKHYSALQTKTLSANTLQIACMDVSCMDFPDKHFDAITGVGALSNFDDPQAALKEIYRVLRDDGQLYLGDFFLPKAVRDIWSMLSAIKYGRPRPYLDYSDIISLLHNADLAISSYMPVRWLYDFDLLWKNNNTDIQSTAKTLYNNLPAWAKREIELQERGDGKMCFAYNSFLLKATKIKEKIVARKLNEENINTDTDETWEVWD